MSFPSMEMHKFPVLAMLKVLKVQLLVSHQTADCLFSQYIDLYVYVAYL